MGLFGKKKTAESEGAPKESKKKKKGSDEAVGSGKAVGKKKKKDGMASLLRESVLETVMADFAANREFIDKNGRYVGLLLRAEDIGGLSKKQSKDEAKGSIVELISSGAIKTLLTEQLLEEERMILIPDAGTLSSMEEFGILLKAPYTLCYVNPDGTYEDSEYEIRLSEAIDVSLGKEVLSAFLAEESDAMDFEPEEPEAGSSDIDEYVPEEHGYEEEYEQDDDIPFEDDAPAVDAPVDEAVYDEQEPYDEEDPSDYEESYDEEYPAEEEAPEETVIEDIPEEYVQETIVRRFYSDALGLEVSTAPFDSQFLHMNSFVPFNEDRGEDFLGQYLSQMAKNANAEMRRLHHDNLFQMRERYYSLIQERCNHIAQELDETDPSTDVGRIRQMVVEDRMNKMSGLKQVVETKKTALNEEWEHKLDRVAEEAARKARREYEERFGSDHEEKLYQIEPTEIQRIEDEYQSTLRSTRDDRRLEALKRLDLSINETLLEVSQRYHEVLEDENRRYKELQGEMQAYLDDNRKDAIARAKALQEELDRSNKAEEAMAECSAKMRVLQEEFDGKIAAKRAEVQQIEEAHSRMLREREETYRNNLKLMDDDKAKLQKQIEDLMDRISRMDAEKEQQYQGRVRGLENDVRAANSKYDSLVATQKHANVVGVFLSIIIAVAALLIGFIGGSYISMDRESKNNQEAIINEFNQRMDALQAASETTAPETTAPETIPETTREPETTQAVMETIPESSSEEAEMDESEDAADESEGEAETMDETEPEEAESETE